MLFQKTLYHTPFRTRLNEITLRNKQTLLSVKLLNTNICEVAGRISRLEGANRGAYFYAIFKVTSKSYTLLRMIRLS